MQFLVIKTKGKTYISGNVENKSYNSTSLDFYKFNGSFPRKTFKPDWYEIDSVPTMIEKKIPEQKINSRYEIKEKFQSLVSDKLPAVCYYKDFFDEDGDVTNFGEEYSSFYEAKFDIQPETWESIEFELNVIAEMEQFEIVKSDYVLKHNFLDELNTHPVLLPTKPCKLSLADSYKIIRNYVIENINPTVAKIESNHDFIFKVNKLIPLAEAEPYQYDLNAWSTRKKAPKYETRYRTNREVKIFSMSNDKGKVYQGEPLVKAFEGKNYEDLQNNIKTYLENLMSIINEEIQDCPHCKGRGIIVKTAN